MALGCLVSPAPRARPEGPEAPVRLVALVRLDHLVGLQRLGCLVTLARL